MWQYNYTNELYHYGVPGMKWGHRKRFYETENDYDYRMKRKEAKKLYRKTGDKTQYKKDKLRAKVDYYKKEADLKRKDTGKYMRERAVAQAKVGAISGAVSNIGNSVVQGIILKKLGILSTKDIVKGTIVNTGKGALINAGLNVAAGTLYYGSRNNVREAYKAQNKLNKLKSGK